MLNYTEYKVQRCLTVTVGVFAGVFRVCSVYSYVRLSYRSITSIKAWDRISLLYVYHTYTWLELRGLSLSEGQFHNGICNRFGSLHMIRQWRGKNGEFYCYMMVSVGCNGNYVFRVFLHVNNNVRLINKPEPMRIKWVSLETLQPFSLHFF